VLRGEEQAASTVRPIHVCRLRYSCVADSEVEDLEQRGAILKYATAELRRTQQDLSMHVPPQRPVLAPVTSDRQAKNLFQENKAIVRPELAKLECDLCDTIMAVK